MNTVSFWEPWLRHVLELAATLAFALSGVLEGARKKLDPVGVCVVAFLAAARCATCCWTSARFSGCGTWAMCGASWA